MTSSAPVSAAARRAGRDALLAWLAVAVAVASVVRIDVTLPLIGHLGSALVAVTLLYAPVWVAAWRKEDLLDYGFTTAPAGKNALYAGVALAVILPLFALGYVQFYQLACHSDLLHRFTPPGTCHRWHGFEPHWPRQVGALLEFCAVQLVVVALPEELFFRGCVLGLLERRWPPRYRLWGGGVGVALVVSSLLFAVIHLPKAGDPRALATFFPGLLFGWMRSATGSIGGSVAVHAASNIWVRVLDEVLLR
ncbi:MAG: CPBP family intramembrane glutamic endopeptidase [Kofleriaceae bacterium]